MEAVGIEQPSALRGSYDSGAIMQNGAVCETSVNTSERALEEYLQTRVPNADPVDDYEWVRRVW